MCAWHRTLILLLALSGSSTVLASSLAVCAAKQIDSERLACFDDLAAAVVNGSLREDIISVELADLPAAAERRVQERDVLDNPFSLTAHQPNYILPITYNSRFNPTPFESVYPDLEGDDIEAKFQISFKAKVWDINDRWTLWGAYTQESWWQLYNDASAPFRETNYQPEFFISYDTDFWLGDFHFSDVNLGLNHQSNGRGEALSRSWNRVIASASVEFGDVVVRPRVWYRIQEDEEDDDNPDTEDYYGYGDLRLAWSIGGNVLSMLLRNNLDMNDNKGAVQFDWSFPLNRRFKGYVQYFYGYGESMIDYDVKTNRIGLGVMMTDWL